MGYDEKFTAMSVKQKARIFDLLVKLRREMKETTREMKATVSLIQKTTSVLREMVDSTATSSTSTPSWISGADSTEFVDRASVLDQDAILDEQLHADVVPDTHLHIAASAELPQAYAAPPPAANIKQTVDRDTRVYIVVDAEAVVEADDAVLDTQSYLDAVLDEQLHFDAVPDAHNLDAAVPDIELYLGVGTFSITSQVLPQASSTRDTLSKLVIIPGLASPVSTTRVAVPSSMNANTPTICSTKCPSRAVGVVARMGVSVHPKDAVIGLTCVSVQSVAIDGMSSFINSSTPAMCSMDGLHVDFICGDDTAELLHFGDLFRDVPAAVSALAESPCAGIALHISDSMSALDVGVLAVLFMKCIMRQGWPPPVQSMNMSDGTKMRPIPWPNFMKSDPGFAHWAFSLAAHGLNAIKIVLEMPRAVLLDAYVLSHYKVVKWIYDYGCKLNSGWVSTTGRLSYLFTQSRGQLTHVEQRMVPRITCCRDMPQLLANNYVQMKYGRTETAMFLKICADTSAGDAAIIFLPAHCLNFTTSDMGSATWCSSGSLKQLWPSPNQKGSSFVAATGMESQGFIQRKIFKLVVVPGAALLLLAWFPAEMMLQLGVNADTSSSVCVCMEMCRRDDTRVGSKYWIEMLDLLMLVRMSRTLLRTTNSLSDLDVYGSLLQQVAAGWDTAKTQLLVEFRITDHKFEEMLGQVPLSESSGKEKIQFLYSESFGVQHVNVSGTKFVAKLINHTMFTTGFGSTSAGSTVKDEREWMLEAGILVLTSRGLCCNDEFYGMREHGRMTIHEAVKQLIFYCLIKELKKVLVISFDEHRLGGKPNLKRRGMSRTGPYEHLGWLMGRGRLVSKYKRKEPSTRGRTEQNLCLRLPSASASLFSFLCNP